MDIAALAAQAAAANPMPLINVPSPVEGLVAHVDGDYCAYFCSGNDNTEAGLARRNLLRRLDDIKYATGATSVVVHLTDSASTKGERYLAATVKPYQGQRNSGRKPRNWETLRAYMETYDGHLFRVKNWLTREADDGMAYVANHAALHGKQVVIATADKDMRMLPGRHIVWATKHIVDVGFNAFEVIGPESKVYGHKWFWLQMIQGDTADNIPGIPLKGEIAATTALAGVTDNAAACAVVFDMYAAKYKEEWADRFVEQAALLWLRTDRDATTTNFLTVVTHHPDVVAAAERLDIRIKAARAELEAPCEG